MSASPPSSSRRRILAFADDMLSGFLAALVIAVLGYLAFATSGCVASIDTTAEPLVVDEDADTNIWNGLGETGWPGADAAALDADADAPTDMGTTDAPAGDTSDTMPPPSDTAPVSDTHPTPDTAPPPPDTAVDTRPGDAPPDAACPSGVYCTFPTGARVGGACFVSTDCCSGSCFDPVPGDGIKGTCYADTGAAGWCGTASAPEWCPGTPDKVCKGGS